MMDFTFEKVKEASYALALIAHGAKQQLVLALGDKLITHAKTILEHNQLDLDAMLKTDPKYDRLMLTQDRIVAIANSLKTIAQIDSPVGINVEEFTLSNGLHLQKKTAPLGVIGMIFEARPNVTLEAFVLCFMSSNACILKGGTDAKNTNIYLVSLIKETLKAQGMPQDCVALMPHERDSVLTLLKATGMVDLIIPRGSQALIDYVKQNTAIPIIETGAGVVHVYVDESADLAIAKKVIFNAKTRRVSVCNALDCLIVHQSRLNELPSMLYDLQAKKVRLHADSLAYGVLKEHYPADLLNEAAQDDFGKEYLSLDLAIKTVKNITQAIAHIRQYSSKHSEAIIAQDEKAQHAFFTQVDAAVVYANASTAFTDGGEFGMGAEIGISTQKLHVRGPFSLQHLVTTKWIVTGNGQVRS